MLPKSARFGLRGGKSCHGAPDTAISGSETLTILFSSASAERLEIACSDLPTCEGVRINGLGARGMLLDGREV